MRPVRDGFVGGECVLRIGQLRTRLEVDRAQPPHLLTVGVDLNLVPRPFWSARLSWSICLSRASIAASTVALGGELVRDEVMTDVTCG
jgi:hypothetical protein